MNIISKRLRFVFSFCACGLHVELIWVRRHHRNSGGVEYLMMHNGVIPSAFSQPDFAEFTERSPRIFKFPP